MTVIAEYDYIYSVIDYNYDYIASGNDDYDYLISCNRLQSITITPTLTDSAVEHRPLAPGFKPQQGYV